MKLKIEVRSWNNYPPPHTHTSGGGGGLLDLPCTKGQLLMGAKLFSGTTQYQKFLLSPKINLFGLHKIAWCPWQPIGLCSWVICSRPKIDTCMPHILSWIFSLSSTNLRKASCYVLAKQNGSQIAKKYMAQGVLHRTIYSPP